MKAPKLAVSFFALSVALAGPAEARVYDAGAMPASAPDATAPEATDAAAADAAEGAGPTIIVSGQREKSKLDRPVTAGILGNKSVLDTPFTVSAVSADEIQNLQTKDLNGAFRDDASITEINSSLAQASGAAFRVRGVALDQLNSVKIDGLAIPWWSIDLPIEQFDQVQLLKGATGFMYGFGSPAGVINYVTKRAGGGFILNADIGFRSKGLFSGHVDVGDRSADGRFGWRVNVQGETGKVYNGGFSKNISGTAAIDYKLTDNLTWSADGFYMYTRQRDEVNTVSVGGAVTHLDTVPGDTNFGARGSWKTNQMGVATTGLTWTIAPDWTAKLNYRWSRLDENFAGNLVTISDNAGDYSASAFFVRRLFKYNQVQALVQGTADTGAFHHDLTIGAEFEDQTQYSDVQSLTTHPIGTGNIYDNLHINLGAYPTSNYHDQIYVLNHYIQKSVFAADDVTLGKFSLLVGLRYTDYEDTADPRTLANLHPRPSHIDYSAHPISPTVALTYALDTNTRLYVSYVGGLQNGTQAPAGTVNVGETFGPIKTKQYEAGIKTEHASWHASAALFQTKQDGSYTDPATATYYQSGTARYRGVEGNVGVKPLKDWAFSASASYIDATLLDEGATYTGKEIAGVPKFTAVGGVDYQPSYLPGLRLDANVKYTGKGYGNATDTLRFPSYTTVDLTAAYAFEVAGHHVVARVGVKNVGNTRYWIYGSSTVIPGEPRTVTAGLHFGF